MPKNDGKSARMFAQDVRRRERRQYVQMPFWQILSFVFHLGGFIALIVFTPLREIVIPERKVEKSNPNITADRIRQLSTSIQTVRLNELMEQLNSLQIILHNMDKMKNDILTDFDAFAAIEGGSAGESFAELFDKIIAEQEETIAAQEKIRSGLAETIKLLKDETAREETDGDETDISEAAGRIVEALDPVSSQFPVVDAAQANAQHLMDRATVEAQFLGMPKTAEATAVLRDTQLKANLLQRNLQTNLGKMVSALKHEKRRAAEMENIAETLPGEISQAVEDSIKIQQELAQRTAEVAEAAKAEQPEPVKLAKESFEADPLSYRQLGTMNLVDAYETAKVIEDRITESYRDIKAAETAIMSRMSFEEASKITDVVKVVRPELDSDVIMTAPETQESFDRQKTETMSAIREADNMVDTTRMLMVAAIEIVQPEMLSNGQRATAEDRLRRMYDLSHISKTLDTFAAESDEEKARDLSQIMAQAVGDDAAHYQAAGQAGGGEPLMGDPSATSVARSQLPAGLAGLTRDLPELVPGNIIATGGDENNPVHGMPGKWVYVNSWYVIGPFPNPNRVNLRRKFAPESVVDLEATYTGKDGRLVKWEFEQARSSMRHPKNRALVIPQSTEEYGIWYAYAEVFVDRECDLWIAVGSDDRSDLWLNDLHVWGSSNELKSWSIDEGFRRVRFQRGRNRFLARVENGWHATAWSVCISLTDDISVY